ncbi:hypothetical protein [Facklamia hominis]|uniref:Uncharacterized protein n=1 Tax=Facklamia hominis CCUG 36813 TaxID=883111 RepID=K1MEP1_9LACT|nr:hypothetical protein [Facklamia hominis]EKB54544.1 hypothetical protein HMPREF9706_00734 [Facklamia hominis CCUG 36813]
MLKLLQIGLALAIVGLQLYAVKAITFFCDSLIKEKQRRPHQSVKHN